MTIATSNPKLTHRIAFPLDQNLTQNRNSAKTAQNDRLAQSRPGVRSTSPLSQIELPECEMLPDMTRLGKRRVDQAD